MESSTPTLVEFLVHTTWDCLCTPDYKYGLYEQIFGTKDDLGRVASAASLSFCPGLLDALQADAPPDVSFFKRLPSHSYHIWGVYVLVLEKPGCITNIYVGSATSADARVRARFNTYDREYSRDLPKYVWDALKDGYKIVRKGLLVWAPLPSAAHVPIFRLLFVAMEATFAFWFWAMKSLENDYGMASFGPWSRDSFTYGGLCSHSSLVEGVKGDFDLTSEQLEAMATAIRERKKEYMDIYNPMYRQWELLVRPERVKERMQRAQARYLQNSPDKVIAKYERWQTKAKASRKFHCDLCGVTCAKRSEFERHNQTRRHKGNVRDAAAGKVRKYHCAVCEYSFYKPCELKKHLLGKLHLQRAAKAQSSSSST